MHPSTARLAAEVRRADDRSEQVQLLADRFAGATCVVVTCGPSLAAVPQVRLREGLRGVLTIAVKQAVDVVGPEADFHCWNVFNVSRWGRSSSHTIRCFVDQPNVRLAQFNPFDISFPQIDGHGRLENSLAYRGDFADHLLAMDPLRPFGPGIMYELVFHLAVHLGASEIITVGWDIANAAGKNTHFYDRSSDQSFFERGRSAARTPSSLRSRVPEPMRTRGRQARAYLAHRRGHVYNRNASLVGESEVVAVSTKALASWLQGIGVRLSVTTDSPHIAPSIERLAPEGLLHRLASLQNR